MSVSELGNGRWAVKWRVGSRQHSRTVYSKAEADILDAQVRQAKRANQPINVPRLGDNNDLVYEAPTTTTLKDYFVQPFGATPSYYERRQRKLARSTQKLEAWCWDRYIEKDLGQTPIEEISTVMIEDWRDDLLDCRVGASTIERAQKIVSKLLNDAWRRGAIPFNPAAGARIIKGAKRLIRPVEPVEVERIAQTLGERDAFMVRFMACTGVRPGELVGGGNSNGLRWRDLTTDEHGRITLQVLSGKTGQRREVRVLGPLSRDLDIWRSLSGGGEGDLLVPSPAGSSWTESQYRNWRSRVWTPACARVGVNPRRPYDLRHGFASLLLHEGRSFVYVANQIGNGPQVTSEIYAHVLDGLADDLNSITAEQAIRSARLAIS